MSAEPVSTSAGPASKGPAPHVTLNSPIPSTPTPTREAPQWWSAHSVSLTPCTPRSTIAFSSSGTSSNSSFGRFASILGPASHWSRFLVKPPAIRRTSVSDPTAGCTYLAIFTGQLRRLDFRGEQPTFPFPAKPFPPR